MSILNFISLGGGVALFLYGMNIMGNGLEKVSGGKMEKMLVINEPSLFFVFSPIMNDSIIYSTIPTSIQIPLPA